MELTRGKGKAFQCILLPVSWCCSMCHHDIGARLAAMVSLLFTSLAAASVMDGLCTCTLFLFLFSVVPSILSHATSVRSSLFSPSSLHARSSRSDSCMYPRTVGRSCSLLFSNPGACVVLYRLQVRVGLAPCPCAMSHHHSAPIASLRLESGSGPGLN